MRQGPVIRTIQDVKTLLVVDDPAGIRRSTLEELTDWTIWADKIISFSRGAPRSSRIGSRDSVLVCSLIHTQLRYD
jgi:hypothetical protein